MSYDRALTVFSPSGQLFQVEYAMQAVAKGSAIVAVKGNGVVVLGAERRAAAKLQDSRTMKKIVKVDDHIMAAFAGLTADARVLINQARTQCQSHRLTFEEEPSVEFIAKWVAQLQQRYTQMGGVRPYGVTSLIAGFDGEVPQLFQTDPSGVLSAWKASAAGKNDKFVREFLEKNYAADLSKDDAIKLTLKALLEVVDSSAEGNIEIVVLTTGGKQQELSEDEVTALVKDIEAEKELLNKPAAA